MTITHGDRSVPLAPSGVLGLRVVLGVRDELSARSLVDWMGMRPEAPGDTYYLVHAYDQLRLECAWAPVVGRRERLRREAGLVVSRALQQVRSRRPGLSVSGAAVPGRADDVLVQFSQVADLVVAGQDGAASDDAVAVLVAQSARCPVLVIPFDWSCAGPSAQGSVTVVASRRLGLSTAVMRFGVQEALRYGTSLRVLEVGDLDPDRACVPISAAGLAGQQERLDLMLEDWAGAHPGLGIAGEVVVDGTEDVGTRTRTGRLTVISGADRDWMDLASASAPAGPPVMIVPPDSW